MTTTDVPMRFPDVPLLDVLYEASSPIRLTYGEEPVSR